MNRERARGLAEKMTGLGNALYNMSQMGRYSDEDRKRFAENYQYCDDAAAFLRSVAEQEETAPTK